MTKTILRSRGAPWALSMLAAAAVARADSDASLIRRVIDRVKPSLVQIYVVSADYREGREIKGESAGSGTIISEDGLVLSNHHVAREPRVLVVITSDREELRADLVGTDALADLALLRIRNPDKRKFPAAKFGDSDRLKVGDTVLAMGSPQALSQSVTKGIVSNTRMIMPRLMWPFNQFTLDGEDVGSIVRWIGHDAVIFPGNSGGPLFNLQGEIVGVNEIGFGLGGAIPGNLARAVAAELAEKGRVSRAWTGVVVQPLLKQGGATQGVLISAAIPGSPAAGAGLRSGDVLLKVGGRDVTVALPEEMPVFNNFMAALPVGKPVELVLRRDGAETRVTLAPTLREKVEPHQRELDAWGATVRDISSIMARELKLDSPAGVFVTSVRPGGPSGAAKPAIGAGDIVHAVAGRTVTNVQQLREATDAAQGAKKEPVEAVIEFQRENQHLVTVVMLGKKDEEDTGAEVRKAWLPVGTQVIPRDYARLLGKPDLGGVRLTQVYPGSTAQRAGLKVGDLILRIDDEPIPAFQPEDFDVFSTIIRQYAIAAKPELLVLRDGKEQKITVELARSPKAGRELKRHLDDMFEFTVREIDIEDRVRESWEEDVAGLLVSEVKPGGWAALARLAPEDLLVAIDGEKTPDLDTLKRRLEAIRTAKPETVVLTVRRGIYPMFLEIEPNWD